MLVRPPTAPASTRRTTAGLALALGAASLTLAAPASAAPPERTIAQVQGTGATSPLVGDEVETKGVVTATYPTGGLRGFVLQTPGSGADLDLSTHRASDAVFVYLGGLPTYPGVGDQVSVQGIVSEYHGLTEVSPDSSADVTQLPGSVAPPTPVRVYWPASEAARESLESMLLMPRGRYRVSDTYPLDRYGEIGLARGRPERGAPGRPRRRGEPGLPALGGRGR